jgi:hypothetical protein
VLEDGKRLEGEEGQETAADAQASADELNYEGRPQQEAAEKAREAKQEAEVKAKAEASVDLTSLPQQQLADLACRAVYPEGAPAPNAKSMEGSLNRLRGLDKHYEKDSYSVIDFNGVFKEITFLLEYAAGAKKKPLMDERLVYWLKLMSVKFTVRLMRNRQAWIKSMLNLSYAGK